MGKLEIGDKALFTGWKLDSDGDDESWYINEPVTIEDIDYLSESGSYPDRYSIVFDIDNVEQDCTASCLTMNTPETPRVMTAYQWLVHLYPDRPRPTRAYARQVQQKAETGEGDTA